MKSVRSVTRLSYREDVFLSKYVEKIFASEPSIYCEVVKHDLTEYKPNWQIVEELGGEDVVMFPSLEELHATLAHLIEQQPKGIQGMLLMNGHVNVVYLRSSENSRWMELGVCWDARKERWRVWDVYAPYRSFWGWGWGTGTRILMPRAASWAECKRAEDGREL